MRFLSSLILALCLSFSFTAIQDETIQNVARYDNYRMYYVEIETAEQVKVFQTIEERSDSYTFYGHANHPNQKLTIMVAAGKIAEFTDILETFKIDHKILTYNFQEKIDRQLKDVMPKDISPDKFDWDHYFHLETINSWIEQLCKKYEHVKLIELGSSHELLPIKGIKLSKNTNNPGIFIESGIHAREWIAPAVGTFIINELLTSNNPEIQKLANDFNWFIFPVVNPDGYKYTFEKDRMWRKNRNLFGTSCWGVDLNRNFPYHWNETGSSPDPCRYDYAGPNAASESETKAIMKFLKENRITEKIETYFSLHSFSQLVMFPYGTDERADNYDDLQEMGIKAINAIKILTNRIYKSGSIYETIYPSSGGSKDWVHKELKIPVTFTFELRGPPNSTDLFILPANEIKDTGTEILAAFLAILKKAKEIGYYNN